MMNKESDEEAPHLLPDDKGGAKKDGSPSTSPSAPTGGITATGLKVLALLAVQNCSKNLIMRYAVQVL